MLRHKQKNFPKYLPKYENSDIKAYFARGLIKKGPSGLSLISISSPRKTVCKTKEGKFCKMFLDEIVKFKLMLIFLPTKNAILGAQGGKAPTNNIMASRKTNTI